MEIPRSWRWQPQRLRLEGGRCDACGKVAFPAEAICSCGVSQHSVCRLSGRGTVYAATEVIEAPRGFEGPYAVAIVELEEGPRISAQLTDVEAEDVRIGMEVEVVTRRLRADGEDGLIHYGYKFRPRLT